VGELGFCHKKFGPTKKERAKKTWPGTKTNLINGAQRGQGGGGIFQKQPNSRAQEITRPQSGEGGSHKKKRGIRGGVDAGPKKQNFGCGENRREQQGSTTKTA